MSEGKIRKRFLAFEREDRGRAGVPGAAEPANRDSAERREGLLALGPPTWTPGRCLGSGPAGRAPSQVGKGLGPAAPLGHLAASFPAAERLRDSRPRGHILIAAPQPGAPGARRPPRGASFP